MASHSAIPSIMYYVIWNFCPPPKYRSGHPNLLQLENAPGWYSVKVPDFGVTECVWQTKTGGFIVS